MARGHGEENLLSRKAAQRVHLSAKADSGRNVAEALDPAGKALEFFTRLPLAVLASAPLR